MRLLICPLLSSLATYAQQPIHLTPDSATVSKAALRPSLSGMSGLSSAKSAGASSNGSLLKSVSQNRFALGGNFSLLTSNPLSMLSSANAFSSGFLQGGQYGMGGGAGMGSGGMGRGSGMGAGMGGGAGGMYPGSMRFTGLGFRGLSWDMQHFSLGASYNYGLNNLLRGGVSGAGGGMQGNRGATGLSLRAGLSF